MTSTIITKNSSTASSVPLAADLTQGELAVNVTDKKLYSKDSGGSVVKLVGSLGNQEANAAAITGGTINGTAIGGTTAAAVSATTLTTSSTVTLNGGTANGVTYLNGSKVLTSGSALTFDGTNLGIGVASPTLRIQAAVSGATTTFDGLNVTNGTATFRLGVTGATYSYAGASSNETWLYSSGTTSLTLGPDGNAPIKFVSNGSEQMRLTSTGLGIGTSSPNAPLTFASSTGRKAGFYQGTQGYSIGVESSEFRFVTDASAIFSWRNGSTYSSSTEYMRLDSAGNLGLGVTPSAWGSAYKALQLSAGSFSGNAGAIGYEQNAYNNGSNWIYRTTAAATHYETYGGGHYWFNAPSGTAGTAISFTQAMTLDASGNLLVGTTSTGYTSSNSTYYTPSSAYWINNHATGTASGTRYIGFGIGVNEVGSITQSGTTGVLYNITSDYRLKTVIGEVTGHGERIDALEPIEYEWKSDGSRTRGFLAHKFQEVYASSVSGEKDAVDADGNPVYQTMQASTSEVIADLVAEIQSLRQRLAAANL